MMDGGIEINLYNWIKFNKKKKLGKLNYAIINSFFD